LGSEFAQLDPQEFCAWRTSFEGGGTEGGGADSKKKCDDKAVNQSAFASWVDCRL
jgi:hypothetical protein